MNEDLSQFNCNGVPNNVCSDSETNTNTKRKKSIGRVNHETRLNNLM